MSEVTCVFHNRAILGEGVFWSQSEQAVYWVDIEGYTVNRFDPISGKNVSKKVGQQIGTVVESVEGPLIICLKEGIYEMDFSSGIKRKLCDPMEGDPDGRLNDGKAGPDGRLYVGSMGPDNQQKLYRLEHDRRTYAVLETGLTCSNGLVWSLDHKTFYYIDSPQRVIWAYDFDIDSGAISNRRVIVDVTGPEAVPDGMTIDAEGKLWVAFWGGSCVRRYDPATGEMLHEIALPVSRVTSCAFGGPSLSQLYITTASIGFGSKDWKREPQAGGLFVCQPGVSGVSGYTFGS